MSRGGLTSGDDVSVHVGLVYDLVYGFEHGFVDGPNHLYLGNYAINANLFYGMLPHYLSAGLTYLFSGLGATVTGSMKFVAYFSVAVSAVFSYKLVRRIDGRLSFGLSAAIATIYFPYRYHCLFYREAFAEGVAIGFIPVFFYGLYMVIDEKRPKASSFIVLVLGLAALIDSHPYTAMISFAGALLLLVGMLRKLIRKLKSPRFLLYFAFAVAAEILIVFPFVVPLLQATGSGQYRLSDETLMWEDIESVVSAIEGSYWRVGFLDFDWRSIYAKMAYDQEWRWVFSLIYFPSACLLSILVDAVLRRYLPLKGPFKTPIRLLTMFLLLFLCPFIMGERIEVYLGLAAFYLAYALSFFLFDSEEDDDRLALREKPLRAVASLFVENTEIYSVMAALAVGFVSLFSASYWENSSLLLRLCQFPFRYWGIVAFFLLLFAAYLFRPWASFRYSSALALMMAAMLAVANQPFVDKRIYNYEGENGWVEEPTQQWVESLKRYGYQNEYAPNSPFQIYYGEKEASYPNSLAKEVARNLIYQKEIPVGIEDYIAPVFLEGEGNAAILYLNTPEVSFQVECTEEAIIQLPQFYYDGYEATASFADGSEAACEILEIDGLLAARLPEGEYELSFAYPGPWARRIGRPLLVLGLSSLLCFALYSFFENKGKAIPKRDGEEPSAI